MMKQKSFVVLLLCGAFLVGGVAGWQLNHYTNKSDPIITPRTVQPSEPAGPTGETSRFERLLNQTRYSEALDLMGSGPGRVDHHERSLLLALENLLGDNQCQTVDDVLELYLQRFIAQADLLVLWARCQMQQDKFPEAIANLQEARLFDVGDDVLMKIQLLVQQSVNGYEQMLRERGQLGELDAFFQSMLVADPGKADYYLSLAKVRQDNGDIDGALGALLPIQYDDALGETARNHLRMLQQEVDDVRQTARAIPLLGDGSRLVVKVVLDGRISLNMLVDTGAAMSVIVPEVLSAMGYSPAAGSVRRFHTANGVVEAPIVRIQSLAVDDFEQAGLQVGTLPLELGDRVDGLLGMNYLHHYRFSIDNRSKRLYLSTRK
jgi:predicted aspartyl protease